MFNERIYNFSAGPAALSRSVLIKAQKELLNYSGLGYSVMEMNHRSSHFIKILEKTKFLFREIASISNDYEIFFSHGGSTLQYSAVPLNLLQERETADYVISGNWAKKAFQEAKKFNPVQCLNSSEDKNFYELPEIPTPNPKAKYVYIVSNNTVYGTQYYKYPNFKDQYIVCDMTSDILSRGLNVKQFGLIFASTQKNLGIAGLCVIIIKKSILHSTHRIFPSLMNYSTLIENNSMLNTPPTYSIYLTQLVLEELKEKGNLDSIEIINKKKSQILYDYLDSSSLFECPIQKIDRSMMNIIFFIKDKNLEKKFLEESEKEGLTNLKGHRSVTGFRASIYNAMPVEGVQKLVEFIKNFEKKA